MSTEQTWRSAAEVFDALVSETDAGVRASRLAEMSLPESVRQCVQRLLRHDVGDTESERTEAGGGEQKISGDPQQWAAFWMTQRRAQWLGARLGDFRIVSHLGSGGMSDVFLAERSGDFTQRAAIKLMQLPLSGREGERRFRTERRALAELQHPHIARLYDAGHTREGVGYLTMEYVNGQPITEHCVRNGLDIAARLKLMQQVCEAVQAAHDQGVIHRDLKPHNILVDAYGAPKILDFGIARIVAEAHGDASLTAQDARCFSLHYASPEQMRGEPCGVQSDVFSLGVVLFELLTGSRPFDRETLMITSGNAAAAAATAIAPSRTNALAAFPRRSRRFKGDLDAICAKALAQSPSERYRSATALASDLARSLAGQAVQARRGQNGYRLRRWLGQHAVAAALVAAGVLALLSYLVVVSSHRNALAQEAERTRIALQETKAQQARAERITDFMLETFEAADPTQSGENLSARALLDRASQRIDAEVAKDPAAAAAFKSALARAYAGVGNGVVAERLLTEALRLVEGDALGPERMRMQIDLAEILRRRSDYPAALAMASTAMTALAGRNVLWGEWMRARMQVAQIRFDQGERESALAELEAIRADYAARDEAQGMLRTDEQIAVILRSLGRYEAAAQRLDQIVKAYEAQPGGNLSQVQRILAQLAALHYRLQHWQQAEQAANTARVHAQSLYGRYHGATASIIDLQASIAKRRGDFDRARSLYADALSIKQQVFGGQHPSVAMTYLNLGLLLHHSLGDSHAAVAQLRLAEAIGAAAWPASHDNLSVFRIALASALCDDGNTSEGARLLAELGETLAQRDQSRPKLTAQTQGERANCLLLQGERAQAEALLGQALIGLRANAPTDDYYLLRAERLQSRLSATARRDPIRGDSAH